MHIQRGDDRKYFQQQASKNFAGDVANLINEGLNTGVSITQKANESTLANNQIDLSTKFLAKNNEINTKYQADPTNPEREVEIQEAFEELASSYDINPVCQGQWNTLKSNVYNRYKTYNAEWSEKQQNVNIETNLKNGYESLTNQISMLGLNGASVDEVRLIYANGVEGLKTTATARLGSVVVDNFLKDADHDIMTTYVSALALNNPLEAQKLLQDEGVRNDIGRAETLEKLESYVASSLSNQQKRTAVNELGNVLRSMNSAEAQDILNGKADLNKVMKFVETNKNLPEGSKDLVLGIYGIGSKTDYYYDRDKKKIVKKEESSSGGLSGSKIPVNKMTTFQKQLFAETLENNLHNLISFSEENLDNPELNVKNIKSAKAQKQASDFTIGYMKRIAAMQGNIDSAYHAGVINKTQRDNFTNSYIAPVTDYLEANLKQLDEGNLKGFGQKLGYEKISKQFNTKGLKGDELRETQRQKLFAQNYYLDELNQVVSKTPHLKSIYDIESLPSRQQQEIYKVASDNALKRAKYWTDKPEYFFAKEYPVVYAQPYVFFNKQDSLAINRVVAESVYKMAFEDENGNSKLDLQDFAKNKMITEINNQAKRNRLKAGDTLTLQDTEAYISRPQPKNINEFYQRVKALGTTPEQFMKEARERGFLEVVKPKTIGQAFKAAHNEKIGNYEPMAGYYYALREAEHAKALQEARKRK